MEPYRIRVLRPAEVSLAVDWAAAEGWNPGLHDAAAFLAQDPEGFLVGELDGAPVAVISAVRFDGFAFVGFYIVTPGLRGRGYGLRLWQAAMARLAGATIGLDGVVAQRDNYRKSGFALAHRNVRYEGVGRAPKPPASGLEPLARVPFAELAAFDTRHAGWAREKFLRGWLALPEAQGWALRRDGRLCGYGVVRRCRRGAKIGPLFAATEDAAEALFGQLAAFAPGEPLFLDPPLPNTRAVALAQRHGMQPVFETARMYAGPTPTLPLDRVYGITTFELG